MASLTTSTRAVPALAAVTSATAQARPETKYVPVGLAWPRRLAASLMIRFASLRVTLPSTGQPCLRSRFFTFLRVVGPKTPSAPVGIPSAVSARCRERTSLPLLPLFSMRAPKGAAAESAGAAAATSRQAQASSARMDRTRGARAIGATIAAVSTDPGRAVGRWRALTGRRPP